MNLTIYVPDDLGKQIDVHRDHLNLSQIFQEAVSIRLVALEALDKDGNGYAKLRQAREESDERWSTIGERDGIKWALKCGDYDRAANVARLAEVVRTLDMNGASDDSLADALLTACEDDREALFGEPWTEDQVLNESAYARGFIAGVAEVLDRL